MKFNETLDEILRWADDNDAWCIEPLHDNVGKAKIAHAHHDHLLEEEFLNRVALLAENTFGFPTRLLKALYEMGV